MKKNIQKANTRSLLSLVATCAVLLGIVIGLLLYVQSLSSRITLLQSEAKVTSAQLATFDRTLCSNIPEVTQKDTLTKHETQSAGYERTYQVHTPTNYDASVRYPVVLNFDGIEGSGSRMEGYSGMDALPVISVYPDSLPGKKGYTSWQGAPYSAGGERDIQFVRDIVDALPSNYCIDTTKIFAVGMSNGGAFATIIGCEMGDMIKAVASVSGAYYTTCAQQQKTPSLVIFHSTTDGQVPIAGVKKRHLPAIQPWVQDQAVKRACKTNAHDVAVGSVTYTTWRDCADNSLLRSVILQGQDHGWLKLPQTSDIRTMNTADYIWSFFQEAMYS